MIPLSRINRGELSRVDKSGRCPELVARHVNYDPFWVSKHVNYSNLLDLGIIRAKCPLGRRHVINVGNHLFGTCQNPRSAKGTLVSNTQVIGRVGALAVALGIGTALAATPWMASAKPHGPDIFVSVGGRSGATSAALVRSANTTL
jgi:hypothetical protein